MEIQTSKIREGINPRRFYDSAEMDELTRSVQANGIIQPIAVRTEGDSFIIVAGHRRYRAATAAGLDTIPCHLVDGKDTDEVSLIENTVRADMSPAEESDAAMRILKKLKGDITEASIHLGWTEDKLRRRLALASCSQSVRDALAERKIKLGIAELLATVPEHENQDKALAKIIANHLSVQEVRQFLAKLTQKLDAAIFNQDECGTCRFNTAQQATLFTEVIHEKAFCTNGACYQQKTEHAAQAKVEALQEEVQTVRLIRMDDTQENFTKLSSGGSNGVGAEQFRSCHSCAQYGAVVWLTPGHEGQAEPDICFDLACHKEKVVAAHPIQRPAALAGAQPIVDAKDTEDYRPSDENDTGQTPETSHVQASNSTGPNTVEALPGHLSAAIVEYRRSIWNKAGIMHIVADNEKGIIVILGLLAKNHGTHVSGADMGAVLEKYDIDTSSMSSICDGIHAKGFARKMAAVAASSAFKSLTHEEVRSILSYLRPNLAEYWTMNADYLKLLTKAQIQAVCDEVGLSEHLGAKTFSGKKEEIITAIMGSGVDFTGLVPSHLMY